MRRIDVVAIAGCLPLLMATCMPMILQAREESRATQCTDRLGKLARACLGFADAHNRTLPSNRRQPFTSWNTLVLPYMDGEELYDKYDFSNDWWSEKNRRVGANHLASLVCPAAPHGNRRIAIADPDGEEFAAAATDYVASSGAYLHTNKPDQLYRGAMASPGRHYGASGVTSGHAVRLAEITDGTSNSMLIVEMADKPNQWHAGKLNDDQLSDNQARELVPGFSFGQWIAPNWNHLRSYTADGKERFGPCGVNCSNSGSIYSFHDGSANVAFADGSVRPLKAGLAEDIMVALASIADGELMTPNDYIAK